MASSSALRGALCALLVCVAAAQQFTITMSGDYKDNACTSKHDADASWTMNIGTALSTVLTPAGVSAVAFPTALKHKDTTLLTIPDAKQCYANTVAAIKNLMGTVTFGQGAANDEVIKTILATFIQGAITSAAGGAANNIGFKFGCKGDSSILITIFPTDNTCAAASTKVELTLSPSTQSSCAAPSVTAPSAGANSLYGNPSFNFGSLGGSASVCLSTCQQTVYSIWADALYAFSNVIVPGQPAVTKSWSHLKCSPSTVGGSAAVATKSSSPFLAAALAVVAVLAAIL